MARTTKKKTTKKTSTRTTRKKTASTTKTRKKPEPRNLLMIVNDVPGEECRIGLVDAATYRLEELYSERVSHATHVSNIYKGRVMNVEPAIQAAFVDFGEGQNGFLHISDLHPRYFPSGAKTERVGKKVPRRDRPPIQNALKRGDNILVQVIKEGIGTKGPTLTSYLSIPGRLMVMMPNMDKVGVSRKIDDEDKRREMRKTLDSLDLPEGMGFILRTAGFGRTTTELKRDLAFLKRLWGQMEKRIKGTQPICPLYVESDVLIRTIRDVLSSEIEAIVVDSESGFQRASDFLRVIAPRSAPKLVRYARNAPIFHTFDIEHQIELIHQREVPLPSGGAIVIEQTEALVAIDVNSGRSRSARDSETNAYRTNLEATDEICRQLRLRDLGGLVVCDLIDMIRGDNRSKIEERFEELLARDRAKAQITRISEFGILEMTRQRMRPGIRKTHYHGCPQCEGRGEVRTPESIAGDALRHAAYLLQYDRIQAVEIVCSARVASSFLSGKRRELVRIEDAYGKDVRIRVSETIPLSRVDYYAYDDRSADVDISKLPSMTPPQVDELAREAESHAQQVQDQPIPTSKRKRRKRGKKVASLESALAGGELVHELRIIEQEDDKDDTEPQAGKKKRRRRRRRKKTSATTDAAAAVITTDQVDHPADSAEPTTDSDTTESTDASNAPPKKKRSRRRRKKTTAAVAGENPSNTNSVATPPVDAGTGNGEVADGASSPAAADDDIATPTTKKKRSRRRRSTKKPTTRTDDIKTPKPETDSDDDPVTTTKKKRTRRRPRKAAAEQPSPPEDSIADTPETNPRSLYGSRRKLTGGKARAARDTDRE